MKALSWHGPGRRARQHPSGPAVLPPENTVVRPDTPAPCCTGPRTVGWKGPGAGPGSVLGCDIAGTAEGRRVPVLRAWNPVLARSCCPRCCDRCVAAGGLNAFLARTRGWT
jgi:alcohol dehydrogenase